MNEEARLYPAVKDFFTGRGYAVRSEVNGCDVVARRGDELVIVELKARVNLSLILQGVDRKQIADAVYLAVPAPRRPRRERWSQVVRLCRLLGLGLLAVTVWRGGSRVDVACEPQPSRAGKGARRRRLLEEFSGRSGDYNVGGSTRRPLVTAYREEALRIAHYLSGRAQAPLRAIREEAGAARAASILQKNYYGWFRRVSRGVYALTAAGERALEEFRDVVIHFNEKPQRIEYRRGSILRGGD